MSIIQNMLNHKLQKNSFPFEIVILHLWKKMKSIKIFRFTRFLDSYKIKPLFIMQDLHPYVFSKNRKMQTYLWKQ